MDDRHRPIDRNALYEEVWSDPVTVVAPRYGISDVALAKACKKLKIPLPGRGYWAKVKAGRKVGRPPLPQIPAHRLPYLTLTKVDIKRLEAQFQAKQKALEAIKAVGPIELPEELTNPHPLTKAAKKRLKRRDGWSNEKGLRSAPDEVLDIEVTQSSLDRALLIFDVLIKELAKRSIVVHIDRMNEKTILDVEGTQVWLAISEWVKRSKHEPTPAEEKAEKRYWDSVFHNRFGNAVPYPNTPRYDYHPTGILTISAGGWPVRSWNDTPSTPIEKRLDTVVAGIIMLAEEERDAETERARKEVERRLAEKRYAVLTQRREEEQEKFNQLEAHASAWDRAQKLRAYIDAVEQHALESGDLSSELQNWLCWARAKADWIDPRIQVSDPILSAPEPKLPAYYF